jgi:glycosyltransferase involved in cell wall biosynthesis
LKRLRLPWRRLPKVAITWGLSERHGWGMLGVHLALYLVEKGVPPLLLERPVWEKLQPRNRERLASLQTGYEELARLEGQHPPGRMKLDDTHMLHALDGRFFAQPLSARFEGRANLGIVAFEETLIDDKARGRLRFWDAIFVHSNYNRRLLQEAGVRDVRLALQGIDPDELSPRPRSGRYAGRFTVFSGGKLEFRKGQDIALAAFIRFHARHPDALLLTAWQNMWPASASGIAQSRLTPVAPQTGPDGRQRIVDWALANGAPPDSVLDLGLLGREELAAVLPECDAAIFPNRCEGATNLPAKEAMACGVPVVLSANTGHLDIIAEDRCLILREQKPVPAADGSRTGWGESSVDELVEHLESLYTDRAAARARASRALEFVRKERTWRRFAEELTRAL